MRLLIPALVLTLSACTSSRTPSSCPPCASAPPGWPPPGGPPPGGPPGGPPPGGFRHAGLLGLDANNDGILDAAEIANAASALALLDTNKDGRLTAEELRPRPPPQGRNSVSFDQQPLAKDESEKTILAVLTALAPSLQAMQSVPQDDGRLLRIIVESIGAKNVVEVGTSQGYSALYLALALRKTGGTMTTFELDPRRAALARENWKRAGVTDLITLVEGDAHSLVGKLKDPIDLLFLDADKDGYLDYFTKLLPLVRPGGLVVAHNMNPEQADPRYVQAITSNPDLDTVFINKGEMGVGLTLKKR